MCTSGQYGVKMSCLKVLQSAKVEHIFKVGLTHGWDDLPSFHILIRQ